jgi:hypothetical protein
MARRAGRGLRRDCGILSSHIGHCWPEQQSGYRLIGQGVTAITPVVPGHGGRLASGSHPHAPVPQAPLPSMKKGRFGGVPSGPCNPSGEPDGASSQEQVSARALPSFQAPSSLS